MKNKMKKLIAPLAATLAGVMLLVGCQAPKTAGLPIEQNKEIEKVVDSLFPKGIEEEIMPGGAMVVGKDGKIVFEKAYGEAQKNLKADFTKLDAPTALTDKKPIEATVETYYDLASVTKVVATTQAVMKLVYEKKLDVNEKVETYLPGFKANGKENVMIAQLFTHTSGLPQWEPSYLYISNDRAKELDYIKALPLIFKPGEYKYSDFGFMTLGYVIEAITNQKLDQYVENEIYQPLGMTHTFYNPLDKGVKKEQIAATSWGNPFEYRMVDETNYPEFGYDTAKDQEAFKKFDGWRKEVLIGLVNDGNAGMANAGVAGHAGVFSTVGDLAILAQMMLNGGTYNGVTLYDQATLDMFTKNYLGKDNRGYGFEMGMTYMGEKAGAKAYGHNGFTGTHFMVDPDNKMFMVVLTNKQNNGLNAKGSYPSTFDFVGEMATAVQNVLLK